MVVGQELGGMLQSKLISEAGAIHDEFELRSETLARGFIHSQIGAA